eukprot:g46523.t1
MAGFCKRVTIDQDCYGSGRLLNQFEATLAKLCAKPAGLFVISGIMAQQIALKIHAERAESKAGPGEISAQGLFACHPTCHLEIHEEKAYAHLLHQQRMLVGDKKHVVTSRDVEQLLSMCRERGLALPCTLLLEIPQRENGGLMPEFADLVKIREITQQHGIKLHLDGARIWEAMPYYREKHGKEYADLCQLFDSLYVSFYKGMGAITGALLLGDNEFITQAKLWRRRFGGTLYTQLPYIASAAFSFEQTLHSFDLRYKKLKEVVIMLTAELKDSGCIRFLPPVPQTPMVHVYIKGSKEEVEAARDKAARASGIQVFSRLRQVVGEEVYFEWKMGIANVKISDDKFIQGWRAFKRELLAPPLGGSGMRLHKGTGGTKSAPSSRRR